MRLSRIFSARTRRRMVTALRLARRWPAAGRLITAGTVTEDRSRRTPKPYDALLVANIRRVVARVGRMRRAGPRRAVQAAAASYLECRGRGWHCSLHLGGPTGPTCARLDLWGTPVLSVGEPVPEMRCVARSGDAMVSVPARRPTMDEGAVAQVQAGEDVAADLSRLLDDFGGVQSLLKPGANVLLKANFNSWHAPPASTGLDLLTATVGALRQAGAGRIALGECSAIALGRTRGVLRRAGVLRWAEAQGVQVRCFDEEPWEVCEVPGRRFRQIVIPACLREFDSIIYLLCAKTHHQAGVSLGLKMSIGFMHPAQRLELHHDNLIERIADASLAVRPDLAVLDARQCFITGGPEQGAVATPGLLLAARQLEALEEAGLRVLADHKAVGLERGREQLACALSPPA